MSVSFDFVNAAARRLLAAIRDARRCDRHRGCHLALAAVHAVAGAILADASALPEAACTWAAAALYAVLGRGSNRRDPA